MKKFIFIFCFSISLLNAQEFKLSFEKDAFLLGTGVLLSGGDLILDNLLKINRQEYKGEIYCKDDVNSLDRKFMHRYSKSKDFLAYLSLGSAMVLPSVVLLRENPDFVTDFVMYAETLLLANGIKEITKLCVNRIRPYMYYDSDSFPESDVKNGDFANSFMSGHTTLAFASATFASYTFSKYFPESTWKIPFACLSYGLATTTAGLRMASGNHFLTDVLAGAVLGSACGFLVPFVHSINTDEMQIALSPSAVSFCWRF